MYTNYEKKILVKDLTRSIDNWRNELHRNIKTLNNVEFDRIVKEIKQALASIKEIESEGSEL